MQRIVSNPNCPRADPDKRASGKNQDKTRTPATECSVQKLDEVRADFTENLSPVVVMLRRGDPATVRAAKAEPGSKFLYY
jgi:hypothetical protein